MEFKIPKILKTEHEELHAELAKSRNAGGRTGEAAAEVAKLMHPHFVKEEEYALPPLGLLAALSQGKYESTMDGVVKMTDKLEADLPHMLSEHKTIVNALQKLVAAAKAENKPETVEFAEKLIAHAQTEEQVSYPAAILVGRFVKQLRQSHSKKAA
jgi:hypothetical protein